MTHHSTQWTFPNIVLLIRVLSNSLRLTWHHRTWHYSIAMISAMVSHITGVSIVWSIVCSGTDQGNHQSYASWAFVSGNHRWLVISPHKGPVKRKTFPLDDVIMIRIGFSHGLSSLQYQIITWTNNAALLFGPFGKIAITEYIYIYINVHSKKCVWKYVCHFVHLSYCLISNFTSSLNNGGYRQPCRDMVIIPPTVNRLERK